ncbi:hypothetical protein A2U01_0104577, partial [Trifolium medium]|nr:hypothetical protein [Trifolium medium]
MFQNVRAPKERAFPRKGMIARTRMGARPRRSQGGNIYDPGEVAVGSTGVVSVRIPPPASP